MAIKNMAVLSVQKILALPLSIPDYQRPYKWSAKHVNQLLDDVIHHRHKAHYRLGTVVFHDDEETKKQYSIVDGQQRLLTLTLLCHFLNEEDQASLSLTLLEHSFESPISLKNIEHNAAIIESRLKQLDSSTRHALAKFVFTQCELIYVQLDDLNEAFQFFDSQNARGKSLAPYDLLKAFHLREMEHNTEQQRMASVASWEQAVSPDDATPNLSFIMSDMLFRLRRWSDGESGKYFTRHHIDVFKGVNLSDATYRYAEPLRAMSYLVDSYNSDSQRGWDQQQRRYPFMVDQVMINGQRFFEYIEHYTQIYKALFIEDKPQLAEVKALLNHYDGRHRVGDHYVRNLFQCAVMYYYDKFGDAELEQVAWKCFFWSYRVRLSLSRVVIESIDNCATEKYSLIRTIKKALHPHDVLSFSITPLNKVSATKVESLENKFKDLGYIHD